MYRVKLENQYGEVIELTRNKNYTVTNITGLNPSSAVVNSSALATMDGAVYNNSRKNSRNIVMTVLPERDIEANRLNLYRYAQPKYPVRVYFENERRNVYIDGYVETHECDLFSNRQAAQISIICPQPFFRETTENRTIASSVEPLFEFEFSTEHDVPKEFSRIMKDKEIIVENKGDTETGVFIEMHATGDVSDPVIYNRSTGEFFALNISMYNGDSVFINTNPGEKSVKGQNRSGKMDNLMNYMDLESRWLVLRQGQNVFTYEASGGYEYLHFDITVKDKFEGV